MKLRAFHEGGQVNIEISDDGAGLNVERIRQKAIERGLVSAQQAARMSDRDIFNMIFLPGFSTAEKVTNVSGRGVGMDVVKTNVEKIGGTVDVQSTAGKGTTVKIKIPLTLAIIPALMVTSGGERFAIPQVSLLELVRLETGEAGKDIEMVHGAPVYRLRGRLLPLVYLNRELQHRARRRVASCRSSRRTSSSCRRMAAQFGLVVDEITDTEEIVVKPMGKQLKGISAYSGATIMGDGRVALILDILGLAQRAQVIAEGTRVGAERERRKGSRQGRSKRTRTARRCCWCSAEIRAVWRFLFLWSLGSKSFLRSRSRWQETQEVMQYRGQIMPLLRLSRDCPRPAAGHRRPAPRAAGPPAGRGLFRGGAQRRSGGGPHRRHRRRKAGACKIPPSATECWVRRSFKRRVTDLLDVPEWCARCFRGSQNRQPRYRRA